MTGFRSILTSMGRVDNRGVEITLQSVNVQSPDWNWNTSLTFWKNNNKLVELYGEDNDGDGTDYDALSNGPFLGHSLGAISGSVQYGMVQEDVPEYISRPWAAYGSPQKKDMDWLP